MIRKTFVSTSALLAVLGTTSALGVVIASDDFSYPDGPLNGSNGGTGWIMTAGALGLLAAIDNATSMQEAEVASTDSTDGTDSENEPQPSLRLTG